MEEDIFEFSTIFINEEPLKLTYLPTEIPFRPTQIKSIAKAMYKKNNMLGIGPTGTGKTLCCKYVHQELIKKDPTREVLYIPCGSLNTPKKILDEITDLLNIKRQYRPSEYDLLKIFKKNKPEQYYLIMDEFDHMGVKQFSRMVKILEQIGLKALFITNKPIFPSTLDREILNRLGWNIGRFERYNTDEIYHILTSRVNLALKEGSINGESIVYLASIAAKHNDGDIRFALQVLYMSANMAEDQKDKLITKRIIKKAIKEVQTSILIETLMSLDDSNKLIILTLGCTQNNSSSLYSIYKRLSKRFGVNTSDNYVTFWRRLNQLERDYSLLVTHEIAASTGKRGGKTLNVVPLISQELFREIKTKLADSIGVSISYPQRTLV